MKKWYRICPNEEFAMKFADGLSPIYKDVNIVKDSFGRIFVEYR